MRKRILHGIVLAQPSRLLSVGHSAATGKALFRAACEADLEGIVAKLANAPYGTPTWIKIKNPNYRQAAGRREKFDRQRHRS